MNGKTIRVCAILTFLFNLSCSRLSTLTSDVLTQSEDKWHASRPSSYRLTIEMKGDRVEKGRFDVSVQDSHVTSLKRNGRDVQPAEGQDYSMDGLFRMLHQEMDQAQRPMLLGAPEGYGAYLMARFDEQSGRLMEYRRTVGGTTNTIDIRVLEFQP